MAQGYDADVQLSVGLSLEDVVKQSRKIADTVEKSFSNVDSSKLTNQMKKVQSTMSKTESQIQATVLDIEELQEKYEHAQIYSQLLEQIGPAKEQMKEFAKNLREAEEAGDAEGIAHWTSELNASREGIAEAEEALSRLEVIGHNVFTQADAEKLDGYKNKLGDLNNQQRLNITAFQQLQEQQQRETQAAEEAARLEQEHAEALRRTREAAGEMDPAIAGTVQRLRELNEEEQRIQQRLDELSEAEVGTTGYAEYNQLTARLQQIAQERTQENARIQQYNQEQLNVLNQQSTMEERLRQREEERARAQERMVAILRGELNPEVATMVDRYQQIGQRIRELETELQRMEQEGHGLGYTDYDNTVRQIEQLRHQYSELQHGIDQYAQSLTYEGQERQRLEAETQQRIATARQEGSEMAQLSDRYAHLGRQLEIMREKQQQLTEQGMGAGYEEYDRLTGAIARTQQEYDKLGEKIQEYNNHIIQSNTNTGGFKDRLTQLSHTLIDIGKTALQNVCNGMKKLISYLKKGTKSANQFGTSFKQIFKKILTYGLGIASITTLFSKMRSAITSGLQTLALMNGGMNKTNAAMTQLTSSLSLLKGSLATAFVPILTTVAPILSNLMQRLAGVINYIGMFLAKLTGAKSYMKATFKEVDYASGTSGGKKQASAQEKYEKQVAKTEEKNAKAVAKAEEKEAKAAEKLAKAQKKANEQLSGLDKLNVINIDDVTDGLQDYEATLEDMPEMEGGAGNDPFGLEEVPLDGLEWNWDEIKKKAEQLGRDLADKLNNIFKNEDLAKNIGHNIAEALNTALNFVYGFVDQFNWRQAGRWLGTLIQEGIETFDWKRAGETLGKLINGMADWIIGFFERYQVGTLGKSIADFINNAIMTIDPEKLGEAVVAVLKAPLIELTALLKETNWKEAGKKFSDFLHKVLTSDELDDKTLGNDIGEFLKAAIDAAIDFLKGMDKSQLASDIGTFFGDIFASGGIETKILAAIGGWKLLGGGKLLTAILGSVAGWKVASGLFKQFGKSIAEGAAKIATGAEVAQGATQTAAGAAEAAAGTTEAAAAGATGAATAATAALGVFDAAIVAYDVGKLVQVHHDWEEADDEHRKAVMTYMDSLQTLYDTAGQEAVNAYAGKEVDMEALYKEWETATGDNKVQLENLLAELNKVYQDAGNEAVSTVAGTTTTLQEEQAKARKEYEEMPHNMWEGFSAGWNTYFGKDGKGIGQLAKDAFSEMVTTVESLLKIGSPSKVMEDIGSNTVKGLDKGLKFDGVISTAKNNINKLINTFKTNLTSSKLVSVGIALINGLKSGLVSGLNSALSTVTSICNRIVSAARKAFQVHSPSKVFEDIGENLMLGLVKGTEENTDAIDKSFENLVPSQRALDAFKEEFITTFVEMTDTAKTIFDDMMSYFETLMSSFNIFNRLQNMTLPKIPDIVSGYQLPATSQFITSVVNNDSFEDIGDIVKNAIIEALTETAGWQTDDGTTIINIDGKEVFRVVKDKNTEYKKRHGKSAFV